uniref:Uncharacterized protein n=1 Tax=Parascaris equorum TaxID=6256 RepID=A0A914RJQ4_PAREQ
MLNDNVIRRELMASLVARGTLLGDDAGSMNMIASKLLWQHGDDDDDVQHAASSTSRLKQRQEAMKRFKPGMY